MVELREGYAQFLEEVLVLLSQLLLQMLEVPLGFEPVLHEHLYRVLPLVGRRELLVVQSAELQRLVQADRVLQVLS